MSHLSPLTPPPPQLTYLLDDIGVPANWRALEGHSVNTYTMIAEDGKESYVKFIWTPQYDGETLGGTTSNVWRMCEQQIWGVWQRHWAAVSTDLVVKQFIRTPQYDAETQSGTTLHMSGQRLCAQQCACIIAAALLQQRRLRLAGLATAAIGLASIQYNAP